VSIGSICEAAAQQTMQQHLPQQPDNSPMPDASRKLDFSGRKYCLYSTKVQVF
jgi:hypothetical protein